MIPLQVLLDGDNCWPDLKPPPNGKGFTEGKFVGIARLRKGTTSGNSTVTVRIELPDGQTVLAETTLALLNGALTAFNAAEAVGR
jgi:hypothetical protein